MIPSPDMIADIHSHHFPPYRNAVTNIRFGKDAIPEGDCLLSIGIHPWDTADTDIMQLFPALAETAETDSRIAAIGETGIDTLRGASPEIQHNIFTAHAALAEQLRKPLIIHAVRSIHTILQLHRQLRPTVPWAIHGFRGKAETMRALHSAGIYTSIGKHIPAWLIAENSPGSPIQAKLPEGIDPALILAETDEADTLPILPFDTSANAVRFLNR